ncbi:hypothetical protein H2O64_16980 [Kordia sp. YSTF-M3]|uniref:Uncharacterized protein n=1 Tax=Kordia aestuariivivens TaxID=2759037 RepID=A0ABR7QCS9_9FLAO|nr:hypothetical protein [Kordia aestuariivivens]MBC8756372.1 hypothetical protein [Kordia aestuariivivens]
MSWIIILVAPNTIGLAKTATTVDFTDATDQITYGSNAQTIFWNANRYCWYADRKCK